MFSPFEWMVALRYLRARRADGFVSVIVLFSFLGIVLGVATLIVVMSVMNGFHRELMDKIWASTATPSWSPPSRPSQDWPDVTKQLSSIPGVTLAVPLIESAAGVSSPGRAEGRATCAAFARKTSSACRASPAMCATARSTASTRRAASPSARVSPSSSASASATR